MMAKMARGRGNGSAKSINWVADAVEGLGRISSGLTDGGDEDGIISRRPKEWERFDGGGSTALTGEIYRASGGNTALPRRRGGP